MSFSAARPFLVCRPRESLDSIFARKAKRSTTASTIRTRTFGGAWRASSSVRLRGFTHRLPSHNADLVLCVHMAGPFSRPPLSQPMMKGYLVGYYSTSLDAVSFVSVRGRCDERDRRDRVNCVCAMSAQTYGVLYSSTRV